MKSCWDTEARCKRKIRWNSVLGQVEERDPNRAFLSGFIENKRILIKMFISILTFIPKIAPCLGFALWIGSHCLHCFSSHLFQTFLNGTDFLDSFQPACKPTFGTISCFDCPVRWVMPWDEYEPVTFSDYWKMLRH